MGRPGRDRSPKDPAGTILAAKEGVAEILDGQGGGFAVADLDGSHRRDIAVVTYAASPMIEIFLNQ